MDRPRLLSFIHLLTIMLPLAWATALSAAEPLEQQLLGEKPAKLVRDARAKGDPVRGATLFYQPQFSCTKCHACGAKEGASPLGPDLARPHLKSTAEYLVESLLAPSKVIRQGFESTTLVLDDGSVLKGLIAAELPDRLVLRDPTAGGKEVVIRKEKIEERSTSAVSFMPTGLTNQLADRQQFLDLAAFLIESSEFGPARARSLRPDPAIINPPLPAYEADIDHAGLIAASDGAAFKRGEVLYTQICGSCHGTRDKIGSMPTSLRFTEGKFRNGSAPEKMYQTLTRGFGMMAAQTRLVPRQKYDVIHYIREAYLRPYNSSQYVVADAKYLAGLAKGSSRGPVPPHGEPWRRMDYGPTLSGTFEIGNKAENIAYKGIAVRLDRGPGGVAQGRAWTVFEHDTLRIAAAWTGSGFINWNGINFNGRHGTYPRIVGTALYETAAGPGWADPETGSFADPRLQGRDGKPYGPLPRSWGRYRGLYHFGDRAVVSYSVGATSVLESPGLAGVAREAAFTRTFEVGPRSKPLALRVLRRPGEKAGARGLPVRREGDNSFVVLPDTSVGQPALVAGVITEPQGARWSAADDGHLLFHLPAGQQALRFVIWIGTVPPGGEAQTYAARVAKDSAPTGLAGLLGGGRPRWAEPLTTRLERGSDAGPFTADTLPIPEKNPWSAQLRLTGLDFLSGGQEIVACSWDGDVWRVSGFDRGDGVLTWRRVASGLFQPLGLKVVDGNVYVSCRDQIAILRDINGDGETDFYECFNSDHQVTEHFHEFAMGLQTDKAGNFLYAKSARHGKPAVVPQHGTLLRVSRDGSQTDILATGFRAANGVCANPDGTFFLTDQEGHWVPKNRINLVRPEKQFFGNMWAYTDVIDPSDASQQEPLCWITNRFDRSPGELLWVAGQAWGGLNGALLNLSYGSGKVFVVPHERDGTTLQGAMAALPLPPFPTGIMRGRLHPAHHDLYMCGMYAWGSNQQATGGLYRLRPTGKPAWLPVAYHVTRDGIALSFSDALYPNSSLDPRDFGLKVWDLVRSENYGSPHKNERPLQVTAVRQSEDRRTVTLTIPELRPTRGLELWYTVRGSDGREIDGLLHGSVQRLAD